MVDTCVAMYILSVAMWHFNSHLEINVDFLSFHGVTIFHESCEFSLLASMDFLCVIHV